jgi:hypothetical protein
MNNIIPNGTTVKFKNGEIESTIIGVCVRGEQNQCIEYNVSYFYNGERKTDWVNSFEISIKQDNSKPMGFSKSINKPLIGR